MKRAFLCLITLMAVENVQAEISCGDSPRSCGRLEGTRPAGPALEIRATTYNVQGWNWNDGKLAGAAQILAETKPHIWGMQEGNPIIIGQFTWLTSGYHRVDMETGAESIPLYWDSRLYHAYATGRAPLPQTDAWQRGLTWAALIHRSTGYRVLAVNTHLAVNGAGVLQLDNLLATVDWTAAVARVHCIVLLGDFNLTASQVSSILDRSYVENIIAPASVDHVFARAQEGVVTVHDPVETPSYGSTDHTVISSLVRCHPEAEEFPADH